MDLTEKIKNLEYDYERYSNWAEQNKHQLNKLRLCKQPSNEDFYKDIRMYVDIKISKKDYMFILGGDGRSVPWDEKRNGIVAEAIIKDGVYLSNNQKKILKDYIKNTETVDHITIIE